MLLSVFTQIHVAISLIGIVSGVIVIAGFLRNQICTPLNIFFLVFTTATSVTGFFFPFQGITPAIVLGVVSLGVLAFGILSWKKGRLKSYIVSAVVAQYLNVLVLIVQTFKHVPFFHSLAPKGSEPIVAVTQLIALAIFVAAGIAAVKRYKAPE